MAKEKFHVLRPHMGDKFYDIGDVREVEAATVKHLIGKTLIAEADVKIARKPDNKKADAPSNKSLPGLPGTKK